MKKKILIITTGGTIAMNYNADKGMVPSDDLVSFLQSFPQLMDVADIEVFEFANVPSPFMTPESMFRLAKLVDLKIVDYDGVVITHGTDTLEETSYMLDLVLTTRKPVVFTAAMRAGSDLGLDGPRNIVGAVRVACHQDSIDKGVLVVMNDDILPARDVVKTDTGKLDSFVCVDYGILGIVDPDRIVYHRQVMKRDCVWTDKIETSVDLIKVVSGMSDAYIRSSIERGVRAIVIEAFGRGNVPPEILPAIKDAISADIIVVIVSKAHSGRVLPEYGYEGGGRSLMEAGAIMGGDMRGHKARIKLMTMFGKYEETELVKKFFVNSLT